MLTVYRRHLASCENKDEGRDYRRCRCPLWVQGTLAGEKVRRSLDLYNWDSAQRLIREWEARGAIGKGVVEVREAAEAFLKDCEARNMAAGTRKNIRLVVEALAAWCEKKGLRSVDQLSVENIREFREGWTYSPITALKKLERLRWFLRFCKDSGWLTENPAEKVASPRVRQAPTLPFTEEEFDRLLSGCDEIPDNYGRTGGDPAKRMRALLLLLRYSGLRIGDAVTLERNKVEDGKLMLYTAKTGTPVYVPLPEVVVTALDNCPNKARQYFFWSGESSLHTITNKWRARFEKLAKLAKVENAHFHRMRDLFAVSLLERNVAIENVSILLGHSDTRITWKHYAPFVKSRQIALEEAVKKTWAPETPAGTLPFRKKGA